MDHKIIYKLYSAHHATNTLISTFYSVLLWSPGIFSSSSPSQAMMRSPSNILAQDSVWQWGLPKAWRSPPVIPKTLLSCGNGDHAADSSTWPRRPAWPWTSTPRLSPWWTATPTTYCGGVVWTALCIPFIRWVWRSLMAKWEPNETLMILGLEERPRRTSVRSRTVVSVVSSEHSGMFGSTKQGLPAAFQYFEDWQDWLGKGRGFQSACNSFKINEMFLSLLCRL